MKEKTDLRTQIETKLLIDAKKLKGKYLPISEKIAGIQKVFPIKSIYELSDRLRKFYLLIVKDASIKQKIRYFIAAQLASQSSDFLTRIAKKLIKQKTLNLKLIQYAIYPKSLRINLLCMGELKKEDDITDLIKELGEIRVLLQEEINNLIKK